MAVASAAAAADAYERDAAAAAPVIAEPHDVATGERLLRPSVALVETRLVLLALSEEVDRLVHGESA